MAFKVLQLRRDTAANWTSNNPTLAVGEVGVETDTSKLKVGDGSTVWTSLDYIDSAIDHDALTNFVANEHIDWTAATQKLTTSGTIWADASAGNEDWYNLYSRIHARATVNGTYSWFGIYAPMIPTVAAGITNLGAMTTIKFDCFRNSNAAVANDNGTLQELIALGFDYGHLDTLPASTPQTNYCHGFFMQPRCRTGTITNMYDIKIQSIEGSGTVTNRWSIYQEDTGTRNYFGSKVGIGTNDPKSKLDVVGLPTYANNAAAVAGGLAAGSFYRTNGDPDLVCVVH